MAFFELKNTAIIVLLSIIVLLTRDKISFLKENKLDNLLNSNHFPEQNAHEKLRNHTKQFSKKEIIQVLDGIYVGIGYALANTIIIEGNTSLIVIDTTESVDTGHEFLNDFRNMTHNSIYNKNISHIIYTHYHPDHIQGTKAFIDDINNPPTIISHPKTVNQMSRIFSIAASITSIRAQRQFGTILNKYNNKHNHIFENSGIGPFLANNDESTYSLIFPTKTLKDKISKFTIDGVKFEIYHAPGETTDQIMIYLPEKRVLFPADNIYRSFPNLYAIRGSPTRDARDWVHSIDLMRYLTPKPEYMVPHHTRPVYGSNKIYNILTIYRDGIAYIHDQTVRYMNKGLTPSQMIPLIKQYMPDVLKNNEYLQEYYGTIDWSIRGIFTSYLGWFDGDSVNLFPLSLQDKGNYIIKLMNNDIDRILSVANEHLINNNHIRNNCQWSLELSTLIILSDLPNPSQKDKATDIRIKSQHCMAQFMTSANGRNYYITSSIEDENNEKIILEPNRREWAIDTIPIDFIMASLVTRLKTDVLLKHPELNNFTLCQDLYSRWYFIQIRNNILEVSKGYNIDNITNINFEKMVEIETHIDKKISRKDCYTKANVVTQCTEDIFRETVNGFKRHPVWLTAQGYIKIIKGSMLDAKNYRSLFEKK